MSRRARKPRQQQLFSAVAQAFAPPLQETHEFWVEPPQRPGDGARLFRGSLGIGVTALGRDCDASAHATLGRALVRTLNRHVDAINSVDTDSQAPGDGPVRLITEHLTTTLWVGDTPVLQTFTAGQPQPPRLLIAIATVLAEIGWDPEEVLS